MPKLNRVIKELKRMITRLPNVIIKFSKYIDIKRSKRKLEIKLLEWYRCVKLLQNFPAPTKFSQVGSHMCSEILHTVSTNMYRATFLYYFIMYRKRHRQLIELLWNFLQYKLICGINWVTKGSEKKMHAAINRRAQRA